MEIILQINVCLVIVDVRHVMVLPSFNVIHANLDFFIEVIKKLATHSAHLNIMKMLLQMNVNNVTILA